MWLDSSDAKEQENICWRFQEDCKKVRYWIDLFNHNCIIFVPYQRDRNKRLAYGEETTFQSFERRLRSWVAELGVPEEERKEILLAGFLGVIGFVDGTYSTTSVPSDALISTVCTWVTFCFSVQLLDCLARKFRNCFIPALRNYMAGNYWFGCLTFANVFCILRCLCYYSSRFFFCLTSAFLLFVCRLCFFFFVYLFV